MADVRSTTTKQTTLRDFLNVVFKRKGLILAMIGAVSVLVFVLNARKPVVYESASRILVRRGEPLDVLSGSIRYLGWAEEVASQIQVILSDQVFERASDIFADSLKAKGLPDSWRFNPAAVRADVVGESNAFVIRYVSMNPNVCQLGCEVMTVAFREHYKERKQPPELTDFFANQIADVESELEYWQGKRTEFLNKEQFYGAKQTADATKHKMDQFEQRILDLDQDISSATLRAQSFYEYSQMSGKELEERLAVSASQSELYQAGMVQSIKYKLQGLALQKEELEEKYTDKHPEVIAVKDQIAELHRDLVRQVRNAYEATNNGLQQLRARRAEVEKELAKARREWDAIPDRDRRLTELDDTIQALQDKLKMLLGRQSETEIVSASRPEWEVSILSHAGPPSAKRTRDYVRLALGPMLALVVGLGVAFFLESLDHSLKNMAEVEEYLDTRVLATISEFRK
jgi:uncharacterized protein involved in exopolysaccharide biosynthesis